MAQQYLDINGVRYLVEKIKEIRSQTDTLNDRVEGIDEQMKAIDEALGGVASFMTNIGIESYDSVIAKYNALT